MVEIEEFNGKIFEWYDLKEFSDMIRREGWYIKGEDYKLKSTNGRRLFVYPKGKRPKFYKERVEGSKPWLEMLQEPRMYSWSWRPG